MHTSIQMKFILTYEIIKSNSVNVILHDYLTLSYVQQQVRDEEDIDEMLKSLELVRTTLYREKSEIRYWLDELSNLCKDKSKEPYDVAEMIQVFKKTLCVVLWIPEIFNEDPHINDKQKYKSLTAQLLQSKSFSRVQAFYQGIHAKKIVINVHGELIDMTMLIKTLITLLAKGLSYNHISEKINEQVSFINLQDMVYKEIAMLMQLYKVRIYEPYQDYVGMLERARQGELTYAEALCLCASQLCETREYDYELTQAFCHKQNKLYRPGMIFRMDML